ncbi:MAG: hypothetical protein C0513_08970 [Isosphaera sp.]|nr:hypothetical protein [Isosphaera sp.]
MITIQRGIRATAAAALAFGALTLGVLALGALAGCAQEPRRSARQGELPQRDTPSVLRGTIGSETRLVGVQPLLVSGYGLVVGLNNTGGGPYPQAVQATMERDLAREGIGAGSILEGGPLAGVTPRQLLARRDVAVVVVEGVIPAGAPSQTEFDVRVRALTGSGTTSLEGGTLWTTELRLGPALPFGAAQTRLVGKARGPVFINPFADPAQAAGAAAQEQADGVTRTIGRVLSGGSVSNPFPLQLVLDNPNHARASGIAAAINARFPPGPTDGPTARGRSDRVVDVTVPSRLRQRSDEFVRIIEFLQVDGSLPLEYSRRYAQELENTPALAEELSWCLVGIGPAAVPFVARLYDFGELRPRLAALRVGALLGDARAGEPLLRIARGQDSSLGVTPGVRAEALELLGRSRPDPVIAQGIVELLDAPELEVRAAAYDALVRLGDPIVRSTDLPSGFALDQVPSRDPLIYVTQQDRPRIVLFGDDAKLARPALGSAWSGRLLISTEAVTRPVEPGGRRGPALSAPTAAAELERAVVEGGPGQSRVLYRDFRTGQQLRTLAPDDLSGLVRFLARKPTPEDPSVGLGLSYSEVIGALSELSQSGLITAAFATERDRLLARVLEAQSAIIEGDRPETEAQRQELSERAQNRAATGLARPTQTKPADGSPAIGIERAPRVVPLGPPRGPAPGEGQKPSG